ncbi:transcription initiation factor IIE subunit alpha-like [Bidens hawaiensis]|uniref:transcription initiation factor IIE subunit alpha-like n=1 Tax=Bidens hawaiensis TaxID=980011 RepID=UPI00404AC780
MSIIEPFKTLVRLTARAFYDHVPAISDDRRIAVVVLDALTRRQWVHEKELATNLKLHVKQLRKILQFFEEKLVSRVHRKETAKKLYSTAVVATADVLIGREGEEKIKLHTHSYWCLDYAQIHDVVRYRMLLMKKKVKDGLDNNNKAQEYVCPKSYCGKRYSAFDSMELISLEDESFHCERCSTELVASCDKVASRDNVNGDEKLRDLLQKMEVQLKPLTDQLNRVKDLEAPYFGTLQEWELRALAVARASNSDPSANDYSRSGPCGTPMPFLGETKVEVVFGGAEEKGEIKSENAAMKVLPPWMIKEGMNLTNEQRGRVNQDSNTEGSSASMDLKDKSINQEDDAKNLQDEYMKAWYAALYQRQKEQEEATKMEQNNNIVTDADAGPSSTRKRQRDDDDSD